MPGWGGGGPTPNGKSHEKFPYFFGGLLPFAQIFSTFTQQQSIQAHIPWGVERNFVQYGWINMLMFCNFHQYSHLEFCPWYVWSLVTTLFETHLSKNCLRTPLANNGAMCYICLNISTQEDISILVSINLKSKIKGSAVYWSRFKVVDRKYFSHHVALCNGRRNNIQERPPWEAIRISNVATSTVYTENGPQNKGYFINKSLLWSAKESLKHQQRTGKV